MIYLLSNVLIHGDAYVTIKRFIAFLVTRVDAMMLCLYDRKLSILKIKTMSKFTTVLR